MVAAISPANAYLERHVADGGVAATSWPRWAGTISGSGRGGKRRPAMTDVIRGPQEAAVPPPPSPAESGLKVGSRIASYRIQERIGRGGMAVVYRALDERLGRQVAVKVLAPEVARDEAFRWRFIHESKAAAAVDHPNIIPIYEAGESD